MIGELRRGRWGKVARKLRVLIRQVYSAVGGVKNTSSEEFCLYVSVVIFSKKY